MNKEEKTLKWSLAVFGAIFLVIMVLHFTCSPREETTVATETASNELVDVFPSQQEVENFLKQFGDYGLYQKEAIIYVVHKPDNQPVTGGHHVLRLQGGQLLGKLGAIEEILIQPGQTEFKRESGIVALERREAQEHDKLLNFLGEHYQVEREGAMVFLVYNGERITNGHHRLYIEGTWVFGQIGTQVEHVYDWTKAPHL